MANISTPHHPMSRGNTDGYTDDEIAGLNAAYVDAWNFLYGDVDLDDDEVFQRGKALWDAIGDTAGNITLVLDRMGRR